MPLIHGQDISAGEIEREISSWDAVRFARLFNAVAWASTWRAAQTLPAFTERVIVAANGIEANSLRLRLDSGRSCSRQTPAISAKRCASAAFRAINMYDREAMLASLDRLEALEKSGARIYFSHDPEFWRSVSRPSPGLRPHYHANYYGAFVSRPPKGATFLCAPGTPGGRGLPQNKEARPGRFVIIGIVAARNPVSEAGCASGLREGWHAQPATPSQRRMGSRAGLTGWEPACAFAKTTAGTGSLLNCPQEEAGFELVWGFSCQVVVFGFLTVFCSERERPFFVQREGGPKGSRVVPVAWDQVPGARGKGRGTETVAKLGGLPASVPCVSRRLDA